MKKRINITISMFLMVMFLILTIMGYDRFWNVITFLYTVSLVLHVVKIMAMRTSAAMESYIKDAKTNIEAQAAIYISVYADYAFACVAAYYSHYFVGALIFVSGAAEYYLHMQYKSMLNNIKPFKEE